ncbi:MAG: ATP-binding cassette domain-containing protein [Tissierellia bacterium]|nr:ATP-binding cassette domain-containing protein [Tissierellia bacterium]
MKRDKIKIEMIGINKRYGDVIANKDIDFNLYEGEIRAIIGENGAGKSTLMRILSGMERPDSGEIRIDEIQLNLNQFSEFKKIAYSKQDFELIDEFKVYENIALGCEKKKLFIYDRKKTIDEVEELIADYSFDISAKSDAIDLSISQRQIVALLKFLYSKKEIIIFDEPGSILGNEANHFFKILKSLADLGKTIIIITHNYKEIEKIADRVSIMSRGGLKTFDNNPEDQVLRDLLTEDCTDKFKMENSESKKRLSIKFRNKIFEIGNEVLGIAEIGGKFSDCLIDYILGIKKSDDFVIKFDGTDISRIDSYERLKFGISYIPKERMTRGISRGLTVRENLIKPNGKFEGIFLNQSIIDEYCDKLKAEFNIEYESLDEDIYNLSGGNIQKVIIAREISNNPKLVIADNPTRGLDKFSAINFFERVKDMRKNTSFIYISSNPDELIGISDRIAIISSGILVDIVENKGINAMYIFEKMMRGRDG